MDEMGKAFEIREGRTLISARDEGKGVKGQSPSITLEARDLSSPHLAMRGTKRHQLFAQDVFSEQGSFLSKADDNKEVPIEGPTELSHGDWIRLGGETRFQVCLIEGIGR